MKTTFKRRMMVIGLSFIICHLSFTPAGAQTFTQRIQQQHAGEGKLVIHHDATIDELVNGKPEQRRTQQPIANNRRNQDRTDQRHQDPPQQRQEEERQQEQTQPTDSVITSPRRTRKAMGYRIQAFTGNDSRRDQQKAVQVKATLRQLFPQHQVYVSYQHPRWLCRMGDFASYADAQAVLSEVRQSGYESATVVRARVNLPY